MTERQRAWAYFARLLLPEMQKERQLLEWIRDEEVERIVAFLESWSESDRAELDAYWTRLGSDARFFRRDGSFTDAGWKKHRLASDHDQERLDDTKDEIRRRLWQIDYVRRIIRYAQQTAEGTLDIQEADEAYRELTRTSPP